jgi:hypothetical protein
MSPKIINSLKKIPLIVNLLFTISYLVIILWTSFTESFGQSGYKIQLFYFNFTGIIIIFILLNSLSVFIIKPKNSIKYITLIFGIIALILYIGFYSSINPF